MRTGGPLMSTLRCRLAADSGSTIWELVAAFFIIGILVTMAVQVYQPATAGASATACRHNQDTLTRAVQLMRASAGTEPAALEDLAPYVRQLEIVVNCPETGEPLQFDPGTGTVSCPTHSME